MSATMACPAGCVEGFRWEAGLGPRGERMEFLTTCTACSGEGVVPLLCTRCGAPVAEGLVYHPACLEAPARALYVEEWAADEPTVVEPRGGAW